ERENGLEKLRVMDLKTGSERFVEFPEPTYSVFPDANPEFNTDTFRYRYQSLVTPSSVYDYDINTGKSTLQKRTEVLGGYDPEQYVSERIYATATDGVRIPISLVYKKGLQRDGHNPALLYGYGAYGFSSPVNFSPDRLCLLDRGLVYAIAHIRGGKE